MSALHIWSCSFQSNTYPRGFKTLPFDTLSIIANCFSLESKEQMQSLFPKRTLENSLNKTCQHNWSSKKDSTYLQGFKTLPIDAVVEEMTCHRKLHQAIFLLKFIYFVVFSEYMNFIIMTYSQYFLPNIKLNTKLHLPIHVMKFLRR